MCAYTAYAHILYVVHQEYGVIEVLIAVYRGEALVLVAPLLVVPTELTEYTEAYGFKLLESTERIDAMRHTTEGTELIACVALPRLSIVRRL